MRWKRLKPKRLAYQENITVYVHMLPAYRFFNEVGLESWVSAISVWLRGDSCNHYVHLIVLWVQLPTHHLGVFEESQQEVVFHVDTKTCHKVPRKVATAWNKLRGWLLGIFIHATQAHPVFSKRKASMLLY